MNGTVFIVLYVLLHQKNSFFVYSSAFTTSILPSLVLSTCLLLLLSLCTGGKMCTCHFLLLILLSFRCLSLEQTVAMAPPIPSLICFDDVCLSFIIICQQLHDCSISYIKFYPGLFSHNEEVIIIILFTSSYCGRKGQDKLLCILLIIAQMLKLHMQLCFPEPLLPRIFPTYD